MEARLDPEKVREARKKCVCGREAVARWMIQHSIATGHGDTLDDLLGELAATARRDAFEEAAKVAEELEDRYAREWRAGHKSDSHMEGQSDGAGDAARAIRSLASTVPGAKPDA